MKFPHCASWSPAPTSLNYGFLKKRFHWILQWFHETFQTALLTYQTLFSCRFHNASPLRKTAKTLSHLARIMFHLAKLLFYLAKILFHSDSRELIIQIRIDQNLLCFCLLFHHKSTELSKQLWRNLVNIFTWNAWHGHLSYCNLK